MNLGWVPLNLNFDFMSFWVFNVFCKSKNLISSRNFKISQTERPGNAVCVCIKGYYEKYFVQHGKWCIKGYYENYFVQHGECTVFGAGKYPNLRVANDRYMGVANVSYSPAHISLYRLFLICCLHICKKDCRSLHIERRTPLKVSSTGFNLEIANSREIVDAAHGELVRLTDFTSCHQPGLLSSHQMSFLRSLIFDHHQDSISSQLTITHWLLVITMIQDHHNKNDHFLSILIL